MSTPTSASPETLAGVKIARRGGIAFGVFLLIWSVLGAHRWDGHGYEKIAFAESVFFAAYGALLLLPWSKLNTSRHWGRLFALVCVFGVAFSFVMVCEVMALNYIADGMKLKAKPPVFQGIQLFFALGQIPTLLFFRRPELLD